MILPLLSLLALTVRAEPLKIALADKRWAVQVDAGDVDVRENSAIEDGSSAKLQATRERDGLTLSVYLEKMPDLKKNAKACRDYYWGRLKTARDGKTDVKLAESRGSARVFYTVPDFDGMKIVQRHAHAFLWKEGACVDVSVIMVGFKPSEQKTVDGILKSVKFVKIP